jgi:hypothetical protein
LRATSRWRGFAGDLTGRQHGRRLHAEIHTDHAAGPGRGGVGAGDLHGRAEPTPGPIHGGCPIGYVPGRARHAGRVSASTRACAWWAIRGNRTCRRSPARPNAPVVNRHDMPCRLPLNLGNRTFGPRRVPFFDAFGVTQRGREVRQARRVRLFRVFRPPRRYLVFGLVPQLPQAVRRPRPPLGSTRRREPRRRFQRGADPGSPSPARDPH